MSSNSVRPPNASSAVHTARRILPLSQDAISQIHSSKHITSLQGVVSCLLENGLDAGATKMDISVDWKRAACLVSDNGTGIPAAEFGESGGLGRMYYTSKRSTSSEDGPTAAMHGRNGTFLAELSAMSLLHIQSVHEGAADSANLVVHHGKTIRRQFAGGELANFTHLRQRSGTVVDVKDLFGNMPVRVKQRALLSASGAENDKAWFDLKRAVVDLLLPWPRKLTVKLKDVNNDSRIVSLANRTSTQLTEKRLGELAGRRATFDLRDALPLLFQSGLAPYESQSRWIPLSASTPFVALKGLICSDAAPSKQCQFIAFGITPCTTGYGQHELFEVVNKVIAHSSFGATESRAGLEDGKNSARNKIQKGVDRHAMYVLHLQLKDQPKAGLDIDRMSDAFVKLLTDVLEAAVTAWLESNMFRPRKRRKRELRSGPLTSPRALRSSKMDARTPENATRLQDWAHTENRPGPGPKRRPHPSSTGAPRRGRITDLSAKSQHASAEGLGRFERLADVTGISGMRSGRPFSRRSKSAESKPERVSQVVSATANTATSLDLAAPARTLRAPGIAAGHYSNLATLAAFDGEHLSTNNPSSDDFGNVDDADLLLAETEHEYSVVDGTTSWKDPVTGQEYKVSSRTGVVIPSRDQRPVDVENSGGGAFSRRRTTINSTISSAGLHISLARRNVLRNQNPPSVDSDNDDWLPGFLKQWNNPVFAKQREEPIPTASMAGPGLLELEEQRKCCSDKYVRAFAYHGGFLDEGSKLSKSSLKHAKVISQVDNKFILVKMPALQDGSKPGPSLVLIDQHAASERIVLESLLTEMCVSSPSSAQALASSSLINSTSRARNLIFEICPHEHNLFTRHRHHFNYWGIKYTTPAPTLTSTLDSHSTTKNPTHRLILTHLPTPIAERCANFSALAIEMLRAEIWAIESGDKKAITPSHTPTTIPEDGERWLSLLPLLPSHLLNMLHSRACRSAVMFNDVLSKQECQELVETLGKCVFPFVCAHGRVGMVPVMQLSREGGFGKGRIGDANEGVRLEDRGIGVDVGELQKFMRGRKYS